MRVYLVDLERSFKIIIEARAGRDVRRIDRGRPDADQHAVWGSFGSGTSVYSNTSGPP
jgi:hypothetical protein